MLLTSNINRVSTYWDTALGVGGLVYAESMNIKSSHKGSSVKTASVEGATTLAEATTFVMEFFNESESRLFDWDADRYSDGTITVNLYTN